MDKFEGKILVIDDDPGVLQTAKFILKQKFQNVMTDKDPRRIPFLLSEDEFDVILLDMNFKPGDTKGIEGLEWLKKVRDLDERISAVVITAYGEVSLAVEAMKIGAVDFIVKPWENEKFMATVTSAWQLSRSRREISSLRLKNREIAREAIKDEIDMVGKSKAMSKVINLIRKVAPTDANVLILGENGTGKEVAARMVHRLSERRNEPFIKVDLGSLSSSLFESELFGHVKGAFTDAKEDKPSRFELASGGTLFLDEIGNISLSEQMKILSAIQNREIFRVGSNTPVQVDIRLICATNRDLKALVDSGDFREDLYYRLNTFEILVPPLRERKEDLHLLIEHFTKAIGKRYHKAVVARKEEIRYLSKYSWPGNIRELQHTIERAVILTEGPGLGLDNLLLGSAQKRSSSVSTSLDELEKEAILRSIEKNNGNMTQVAIELGLGRTTLYRKIKKYGL